MKDRKKTVLITAGATGIGRVIAELFLTNKWNVHICDINKEFIDKFLIDNPNASASHIDVGCFDQVKFMFKELIVPLRVPEMSETSAPSIRPSILTPAPTLTVFESLSPYS